MSSQSHLVSPKANVASFPIYDNSEDKDFRPNDKLKKSIGKSPKRERGEVDRLEILINKLISFSAEKRVASKQYNFVDPFPVGQIILSYEQILTYCASVRSWWRWLNGCYSIKEKFVKLFDSR